MNKEEFKQRIKSLRLKHGKNFKEHYKIRKNYTHGTKSKPYFSIIKKTKEDK